MLEDARATAVIPVHSLSRARVFYEKMLGLTPSPGPRPETEVTYSLAGGTQLLVYETEAELGGATKVTLTVTHLDTTMNDLRNHGVKFEDLDLPGLKTTNGVYEDVHSKVAWFKDLEGNWLALTQLKQ
jgi:catechol-2,3-dioxygenase